MAGILGRTGKGLLMAATLLVPTAAAAEAQPNLQYPAVENATFHQLAFNNADVAILNNLYPPHSDSGFHSHPRELFYVVVAAALASTQKLGGPVVTPEVAAPVGSVGFNLMPAGPLVHRVINDDNRAYHVIAVEIRRPEPTGASVTDRGKGYTQIFDNNRVRAWRVVLEPGQGIPALTQRANGVRVVVRGGMLRTARPGIPDQTLALQNADFAFQAAGETRALDNVGKTTIEVVELELK